MYELILPVNNSANIELIKKTIGWLDNANIIFTKRHSVQLINIIIFFNFSDLQILHKNEKDKNPNPVKTSPNVYTIFTTLHPKKITLRSLIKASINIKVKKHNEKHMLHKNFEYVIFKFLNIFPPLF